jgi:hypothetical protein
MADLRADEYRALRNAVASRGQLRVALALAGLVAWAFALLLVLALLPYPVAAAVPLILLWATCECLRPLNAGAERIGRYLQVFYEEADASAGERLSPPAWERVAMTLGATVPGAAGHPLFVPPLLAATLVNFLAVVLPDPVPVELSLMAVPHAALVVWLLRADRAMRVQRTRDLARLRGLRDAGPTASATEPEGTKGAD